jgi:hypothetical protein
MMRSIGFRVTALLAALLLSFAQSGLELGHGHCPVHDSLLPEATTHTSHQHGANVEQPADSSPHSGGCTCVGVCCVTSVSLPTAFAPSPILTASVIVRITDAPPALVLPSEPEFLRPFASGPPTFLV